MVTDEILESTEAGSAPALGDPLLKCAAIGLIFVLAMVVLYFGRPVVFPVVLAVLVTYALEPLVRFLTNWHIPRALAAMIVIVGLYGGAGITAYNLRGHAAGVIATLPQAFHKVQVAVAQRRGGSVAEAPVSQIQQAAKEIEKTASAVSGNQPPPQGVTRVQVEEPPFNVQEFLWSGTTGLLGLLGQGIVLTFLVFFLLASGDLYRRKIVRIVGTRLGQKRVTVEALQEINTQIERFLMVQVLTSALVAFATWVLLAAIGLENAVVWAIAAGVLNSVPYFGAIVVSLGLALVTFLQFGTVLATVEAAGGAFAITSLEGMLLTPALMGKAAGINQVAMFVSLLFWGWMWGVLGTLIAVPIMMVVKTICERVESLQPVGELLSER